MRVNGPIQLFPLVRVALVLIVGIVVGALIAGEVRHGEEHVALVYVYGLFLVSVGLLLLPRLKAFTKSFLIWVSVGLLGTCLFLCQHNKLNPRLSDQPVLYEAVLTSEPEQRGKVVRFDMTVLSGPLSGQRVKASVLRDTVEQRYRHLHIGDGIRAFSVMEPPRTIYQNAHFNYPQWLRAHGFVATTFIYYTDWEKCQVSLAPLSAVDMVRLRATQLRERLLRRYRSSGLADETYALVAAMTLGDKSALKRELKETYAVSGASHVLALSGLHLGIISILLLLLFRQLRLGNMGQAVLVPVVWLYVFVVGLSPSVVRAAIMLTVYAVVSMLGRDKLSLNTLALAALLMLVFSPMTLWDVGFQLSFMAMLSIFLFFRPVYRCVSSEWLDRHRLVRALWTVTVVSFTAQIGTAPLVAYHFGRFSSYFLLANFLVVPCAYAILCGALLFFLTTPFPVVQGACATFIQFFATTQSRGLEWIASLPGASIEGLHPSAVQVVMIYLFIGVLALIGRYVRKMHRLRRQFAR